MGTGDLVREAKEKKLLKSAENYVGRLGLAVISLDDNITDTPDGEHFVNEIRFKVRYDEQGDILVVVKAFGGPGKTIAFHSADTVAEGLLGLANRLTNGTLKWKEDKPYDERDVGKSSDR